MLEVSGLQAAYGQSRVLFGVDLAVREGEVVTLLGRNGMGKTTIVRSIFGLLKPTAGRIAVDGSDVAGLAPHIVARRGLGLVPEGRQVFPTLSVEENLVATARAGHARRRWSLTDVYALFPRLRERRAQMGDKLSGGEQQMLAIGRALMTNPRLVVLDEATEGLAPLVRAEIWQCLRELKAAGVAILVVDRHVEALSAFADRHVVVEKGRVAWSGTTAELAATPEIGNRFLSV